MSHRAGVCFTTWLLYSARSLWRRRIIIQWEEMVITYIITVKETVDDEVHVWKTINPHILLKDVKPYLTEEKTETTAMVRKYTISLVSQGSQIQLTLTAFLSQHLGKLTLVIARVAEMGEKCILMQSWRVFPTCYNQVGKHSFCLHKLRTSSDFTPRYILWRNS